MYPVHDDDAALLLSLTEAQPRVRSFIIIPPSSRLEQIAHRTISEMCPASFEQKNALLIPPKTLRRFRLDRLSNPQLNAVPRPY